MFFPPHERFSAIILNSASRPKNWMSWKCSEGTHICACFKCMWAGTVISVSTFAIVCNVSFVITVSCKALSSPWWEPLRGNRIAPLALCFICVNKRQQNRIVHINISDEDETSPFFPLPLLLFPRNSQCHLINPLLFFLGERETSWRKVLYPGHKWGYRVQRWK